MDKLIFFLEKIRSLFFELNTKQREHISKLCHLCGMSSTIPLLIKIATNGKPDSWWLITIAFFFGIMFEVLAIVALATKDEK